MGTALASYFTTLSCSGTATCTCTFTRDDHIVSADPSAIAGTTLTTNPGGATARTFGFCVAGSMLTYKETTSSAQLDPGIYAMAQ